MSAPNFGLVEYAWSCILASAYILCEVTRQEGWGWLVKAFLPEILK